MLKGLKPIKQTFGSVFIYSEWNPEVKGIGCGHKMYGVVVIHSDL